MRMKRKSRTKSSGRRKRIRSKIEEEGGSRRRL